MDPAVLRALSALIAEEWTVHTRQTDLKRATEIFLDAWSGALATRDAELVIEAQLVLRIAQCLASAPWPSIEPSHLSARNTTNFGWTKVTYAVKILATICDTAEAQCGTPHVAALLQQVRLQSHVTPLARLRHRPETCLCGKAAKSAAQGQPLSPSIRYQKCGTAALRRGLRGAGSRLELRVLGPALGVRSFRTLGLSDIMPCVPRHRPSMAASSPR